MNANQKNNFIDLDRVRHDLANAIGTLQTAIGEIRTHATGAADAFELYDIGIDRLNNILAALDGSQKET